jgi:hypothetical protein
MIGKIKYKGTMKNDMDDVHIFGKPTIKGNDYWNVGKCINGDFNNPPLLEDDRDLGRSLCFKSKLSNIQPKEYDPNKIFGIPSIRYDLPKKRNISVQDKRVIISFLNF